MPPSSSGGMPYACGSNGTSGMKPPRLHGSRPSPDGSSWTAGSQCRTSVTASAPATTFAQKPSASRAPGKTQPMPMIAMSAGRGRRAPAAGPVATTPSSAARAARNAVAPAVTCSCRAATPVVDERSAATSPIA